MSKLYFAIVLSLIKIKSLIWIVFFRIFGANISFSTQFIKKPFILGYLKNINIGKNVQYMKELSCWLIKKEKLI